MTEHYDLPHRFADYCAHAGGGKACSPCRRAFAEVYRLAHIDFQTQVRTSIDDAMVKLQAAAWDEGAEAGWLASGEGFNGEYAHGYGTHDGALSFREASSSDRNPYRPQGEVV